ncbi:MAG TPA: EAL domain-containing protein [Lichenihabitans sp.]|nr:EAL domain-containing protein [Lichenihabitans sp.]
MRSAQALCLDYEDETISRCTAGARIGELDSLAGLAARLFGVRRVVIERYAEGRREIVGLAGFDGDPPQGVETESLAEAPIMSDRGHRLGLITILRAETETLPDADHAAALPHLATLAGRMIERQAALSGAEGRLDALFRCNPVPMWIYDPESLRFIDVNDAMVEAYGHPRAALLSMTVLDIRPPDEQDRMVAATRDGSDLGAPAVWRHCRADGTPIEVVTYGRAITVEGREAVLAAAFDRTEVHTLRDDLGRTRLLLDSVVAALPVGIFLKDMEDGGRYLIYNAAISGIVGRAAETVIGRRDRDIFEHVEGSDFAGQDRRVMASGRQLVIGDEPVTRPNGETRRIRTVKKPLPMLDGSAPRYLLGISEDVTERRASEDRMAHMASHDSLTDLPSRLHFEETLAGMLARPGRRMVTLLCLDLDGFKTINDTYGHPVGDELLRQVAARLRAILRRSEVAARLGGDEFAVLGCVEGGPPAAMALAARIARCFRRPFDLGECTAHIDVSIGIALAEPSGRSGERLMRHADIALYAAKSEGRGVAKLYAEEMSVHVEARQLMSEDLRRAVAAGEFELDYQPLHNLGTDRITGFEALVRWRHPERGLIGPGEFIPVAEQNGLIVEIGDWVLREACRQAAGWPDSIKVAVNLSAVQFRKAGLVAMVEGALRDAGLAPQRLELEITESILLADSGTNLQTLHDLRALGIRIAMDDFGTGYSSLSYLRSFPFDKIKMDRSFVADVCVNPGSMAIVRAVTGLGSSLSITTTAEGIETPEQFARLKQEGFDELQGYLIGRPMPADRASALARRQAGPNERDVFPPSQL